MRACTLLYSHSSPYVAASLLAGKRIVTASWEGTAKVRATATGEDLLTFMHGEEDVFSCAFSTDHEGRCVLTGGCDGTAILWDSISGEKLVTCRCHMNLVSCFQHYPDTCALWLARVGMLLRMEVCQPDDSHFTSLPSAAIRLFQLLRRRVFMAPCDMQLYTG